MNQTKMQGAIDFYHDMLERGDPRVERWLLMANPITVVVLFAVYMTFVLLGPRLMKNVEAFKMREFLCLYNAGLVALSVYMFKEFLITSVLSNYSYLCQPVDYSTSPLAMRMANVCWWFFFSKVIELLDTVFFILRKKFRQVSFLHVYHHATMIFNWWAGVKYVAGGQSFFTGMLNSFVHIFMYSYYALSVFPQLQKHLWWKKYLTRLQLVQFFAFVIHTGYNLFFTDCDFPQGFNIAVFGYAISLIILFGNFYLRSYIKGSRKRAT